MHQLPPSFNDSRGFFQKQLDELHFGDGKFITHVGSDGKVAPSFEEIVIFNWMNVLQLKTTSNLKLFNLRKRLLGGGFNPFEKICESQIGSWNPKDRGENKKCLSCHHPGYVFFAIKNHSTRSGDFAPKSPRKTWNLTGPSEGNVTGFVKRVLFHSLNITKPSEK